MNSEKSSKIFKKIPGCDLGTTNSAVAVFSAANNNIEVIANELGARTTPSLIYFSPDGQIIVGENARKFMDTQPERVVYEVKRLIGRKFDDPSVQEFVKKSSYKIVRGRDGEALVKVGEKEYSPVQLSAFILKEMKNICQNAFPDQVISEMIITVPAHFNDAQRQATKDAGEVAGLKVERIINEPTAAALAYGLEKSSTKETIAVFDLGGGTFDISIIELDNGMFNVKATNGDTWLGGSDFDAKIVQWLIKKTKEKLGVELEKDNLALHRFKGEAIRAKHHLSQAEKYEINLPYIAFDEKTKQPIHFKINILRQEFEDIVQDLLKKIVKPSKDCLKDAGLETVDKVIMVGGMTRVPAVQRLAQEIFKKEPNKSINPDEAVAIGAAVQGSVLSGANEDILLLDVNPLSLGLETFGSINSKMIKRNTTIPTQHKQIFSTAADNQEQVTIRVIEGEGEMSYSAGNRVLGTFDLVGIRPAPRGVPKIEVEFSIDSNGILSVKAVDLDTGKEQKITITGRTKNEEEIKRMIQESKEREEEDKKLKKNAELMIEGESFCYSIKKELESFAKSKLEDQPQYQELETIYNNLNGAIQSNNHEALQTELKEKNVGETIVRLIGELKEKQPKEEEPSAEANTNSDSDEGGEDKNSNPSRES